jgi:spermidine synthase
MLILFVGSGCAALIYEIVWLQMLQLVIGSNAMSLGILLGTFMGGMCIGSLLLPRLISPDRHPLRVYAALEIGIAAFGVLILVGMPLIEHFYTTFGHDFVGIMLRGLVAAICLLPPTILMGATLPAVARWVETTPQGVSWLGFFYGGNIVGAVVGCLLAGFYLLRVYDMPTSTFVAVAINLGVAGLAFLMSAVSPHAPARTRLADGMVGQAAGTWPVYVAIGLSGLCALGAEVVWTRVLSLTFGGTVYTFSIILGVFLIGLGIGSSVGAMVARSVASPRAALGVCQLLLTGAIAWTAWTTARSMPFWPIDPSIDTSQWFTIQLDLARAVWAMLPAACLWGASFPLALAAAAVPGQEPGRLVGRLYAVNTVGAIIGALAFSMWLIPVLGTEEPAQLVAQGIPRLGTQTAQQILIALSFVAALFAFLPVGARAAAGAGTGRGSSQTGIDPEQAVWWLGGTVVSTAVVVYLVLTVKPMPWGLAAYGRYMATYMSDNELALDKGVVDIEKVPQWSTVRVDPEKENPDKYCLYWGEGTNVTVAVTESNRYGDRSFHGGGKVQASSNPADMRLQRMLGHIPALVCKNPKEVLVVACGAGVTAGSFIPHPDVESIVICDIERLVPERVAPFFARQNFNVVGKANRRTPENPDGRVEVVIDDGRHYIRTTKRMFDVITSDPIDPWVKGCAALNTKEYYEMCKAHLNDGGVMALWMPIYESNEETLKSVIGTFFEVFPHGILWTNDVSRKGYDAILFGQKEPTVINLDEMEERLNREDHRSVLQSMREVGFNSMYELLGTYAGEASRMKGWTEGAQINTDRNLRLQYLAGLSLNNYIEEKLLNGILEHYEFPKDIFVGSEAHMQALKRELTEAGRPQ